MFDPRPEGEALPPDDAPGDSRPFADSAFAPMGFADHTPISILPDSLSLEFIIGQYEWARSLRDEGLNRSRIEELARPYFGVLAGIGLVDHMRFETNLATQHRLHEAILNALFREPHHGSH